ncbi:hypothetical protein H9X57_03045 [Flavobacterium piscinae]|nr:hypothetical protein [Flavobacterium piscinae]
MEDYKDFLLKQLAIYEVEGNLFESQRDIRDFNFKIDSNRKRYLFNLLIENNITYERVKLLTKGLRESLKEHSVNYYERGISKISDYEYDILFKILTDLEEILGEFIPSSITRKVGINPIRNKNQTKNTRQVINISRLLNISLKCIH